jgi:uroporphyrinogen-III decarboxylase
MFGCQKPITLFGTIDPSRSLCRGNTKEVEAKVKEDIRLLGRAGSYVLRLGSSLPCSTPFENIRTGVETGCQYGEYGKNSQPVRISAR